MGPSLRWVQAYGWLQSRARPSKPNEVIKVNTDTIWFHESPHADTLYQARKLVPAYSASNTLASTYLIATSNSTLSSPPNPTQHKPLYAFCLTSSKIPKYVPTPPKKKDGSRTVSGYIAPKLPALRLRQQRMPRYPLDLLAPLRLRLLRECLYASGRAHACR
jgi:hypothetical protein